MTIPDIKAYEPYGPNSQSLTEVLIDLKETIAAIPAYPAVAQFNATAAATVTQGAALCMYPGGLVQNARNSTTFQEANVIGFALNSALAGEEVDVAMAGILPTSGLSPGQVYYLGNAGGSITATPPTVAGGANYLVRLGEAVSTGELAVQIEPPISLN